MSDIKIASSLKDNEIYRIKSYTILFVVILIVVGCLLMVGKLGPDFFAIILFLFIMMIPIILIFKDKLIDILPDFVSDNLFEVDNTNDTTKIEYNLSKMMTQIGLYVSIIILCIGSGFFLYKGHTIISDEKVKSANINVRDLKKPFTDEYMTKEYPKALYKILGSLFFITVSGIIILEIDNI